MSRSDPKRITINTKIGFAKVVELSEPSNFVFPSIGLFDADGRIVVWVPEDKAALFFRSLVASNEYPKQTDGIVCELFAGMSYFNLVRNGSHLYVIQRDHGLNIDMARLIISPTNAFDIAEVMKELA